MTDRLFLLRPPATSEVGTALGPLVRAAAEARVRRVVVLSVMGVNPALPHWRMERMVQRAGLPMTALRPACFAQNLLTAFGHEIRAHVGCASPAGTGGSPSSTPGTSLLSLHGSSSIPTVTRPDRGC